MYNSAFCCNNLRMIKYDEVRKQFNNLLADSSDILYLDFEAGGRSSMLVYVDGLSDKQLVDRNIIEPLKKARDMFTPVIECVNRLIFITDPIKVSGSAEEAVEAVADGDIALVIDGAESIFILSMKSYPVRSIAEPPVSTVLRGPREGFVEDMKINMTLVRRRLRSPKLVFYNTKAGKYTGTNISIAYLDGVADNSIVEDIKNKISKINIDGIIDSSYVARFLEKHKYSLFNEAGMSEKPDIVAAKMLEGRIAIIVDGSPTVLTVPFVVFEHFQTSEDYYIKGYRASFTRIIRMLGMIIAIALPGAYVALQEFQYQMLPLKMLTVIMNSIYGVPLPPVLEMLALLIVFEILNETSIRMPRYVATALSIVGAIVLGEAAVNAGLLSTPALLVTALSTIGLYAVPDEVDAASLLRILLVLVAGVLGLFGLLMGVSVIILYLASINSYRTGYLAPFAPLYADDMKDGVIKKELTEMKRRPFSIPTKNRTRLKDDE